MCHMQEQKCYLQATSLVLVVIDKSGKCLVKWDKGWQKGNTAGVEPDDLVSEEEAEKSLTPWKKNTMLGQIQLKIK